MGRSSQRWRFASGLLTLSIALLHIFWPSRVQMDWPTIALLAISFAFICGPELSTILPLIKRLRLGEAEIEMQDSVKKLHEEVEEAENAIVGRPEEHAVKWNAYRTWQPGERSERSILALAARDKESALVLLAIEIEKELFSLSQRTGLGDKPPRTIRDAVDQMVSKGIFPAAVGKAIIEFRNVRNKVIHPIRERLVDEAMLTSAIDSGIRILRLLRSGEAP